MKFGPDGHLYAALDNRGAVLKLNGQTGALMSELTAPVVWDHTNSILFTVPELSTFRLLVAGGMALGLVRRRAAN